MENNCENEKENSPMIYTSSNQNLTARILVARDWKDLRDIRLEAIRVDGKYFFIKQGQTKK